MYENTLRYKLSNNVSLTDSEKSTFFNLVSFGCHAKNKRRLHSIIFYGPIHNNYGIYERVYFENDQAHYCAGQSYPDEIRTVRECLLEN
jgi:hypothetical protein